MVPLCRTPDGVVILRTGASALSGATLPWLGPGGGRAKLNGAARETQRVEHWGICFYAGTLDAAANDEHFSEDS